MGAGESGPTGPTPSVTPTPTLAEPGGSLDDGKTPPLEHGMCRSW